MKKQMTCPETGEVEVFEIIPYDDQTEEQRRRYGGNVTLCCSCKTGMHYDSIGKEIYTCRNGGCSNFLLEWIELPSAQNTVTGSALAGKSSSANVNEPTVELPALVAFQEVTQHATSHTFTDLPRLSQFLATPFLKENFTNHFGWGRRISSTQKKNRGIAAILVAVHIVTLIGVVLSFHDEQALLAIALLVYSIGLRHTLDGDKVAIILNMTHPFLGRKSPLTVGIFFALGQASVVFIWSGCQAILPVPMQAWSPELEQIGPWIGTLSSALSLSFIGGLVLLMQADAFLKRLKGTRWEVSTPGKLKTIFHLSLRLIDKSWKMIGIGVLMSLSFDTASAIGELSRSATVTAPHLGIVQIAFLFPFLFAEGLLLGAFIQTRVSQALYQWTPPSPGYHMVYRGSMTLISACAALIIGSLEFLSILEVTNNRHGGIWDIVSSLDLSNLGYKLLILFYGTFLGCWIVAKILGTIRSKRPEEYEHSS